MDYAVVIVIVFIVLAFVIRSKRNNELEEEFDSRYRGMTHDIYEIDGSTLTYDVLTEGYVVAKIKYSWFKLGGKIEINNRQLVVYRKLSLLPKFEIRLENGNTAAIKKNKWFKSDYSLLIDGNTFRLRYVQLMFAIFQNDLLIGKREGENIYLPKSLSLEKKMMLVWLDTYIHFIGSR